MSILRCGHKVWREDYSHGTTGTYHVIATCMVCNRTASATRIGEPVFTARHFVEGRHVSRHGEDYSHGATGTYHVIATCMVCNRTASATRIGEPVFTARHFIEGRHVSRHEAVQQVNGHAIEEGDGKPDGEAPKKSGIIAKDPVAKAKAKAKAKSKAYWRKEFAAKVKAQQDKINEKVKADAEKKSFQPPEVPPEGKDGGDGKDSRGKSKSEKKNDKAPAPTPRDLEEWNAAFRKGFYRKLRGKRRERVLVYTNLALSEERVLKQLSGV